MPRITTIGCVSRTLPVLCALLGSAVVALGADLPVRGPKAVELTAPPVDHWSFRFVPYAWITALDGSTTVRGRTVDVNASFSDILDKSDSIFALMGYFEARKGNLSLFTDLVYSNLTASKGASRSRRISPHVSGSIGASLGADAETLIAQFGAGYEIAQWRSGGGSVTALELIAGGRYWWQNVDIDLALAGTLNIGGLTISGSRAIAASGDVDWVDPFIGARLRHQFAPGHEFTLTGDIGGFGVGSDFSWQLVGAYSWDFSVTQNAVWSAIIGYRALSVDYAQGSGINRYAYDMVQHGPILGVSMRF